MVAAVYLILFLVGQRQGVGLIKEKKKLAARLFRLSATCPVFR